MNTTYDLAIESFIEYLDEMEIVEEGFKDSDKKVPPKVEKIFQKMPTLLGTKRSTPVYWNKIDTTLMEETWDGKYGTVNNNDMHILCTERLKVAAQCPIPEPWFFEEDCNKNKQFICIGAVGNGDFYLYCPEDKKVYYACHDDMPECKVFSNTFEEFKTRCC